MLLGTQDDSFLFSFVTKLPCAYTCTIYLPMWVEKLLSLSLCGVSLSAIFWQALDRLLDYLPIKKFYRDKSKTSFFKKWCCMERAVLTYRSTDRFILCFIIVLKRISAVCNICATLLMTLINPSAIDVHFSCIRFWPMCRNLYLHCRILWKGLAGNSTEFYRKMRIRFCICKGSLLSFTIGIFLDCRESKKTGKWKDLYWNQHLLLSVVLENLRVVSTLKDLAE